MDTDPTAERDRMLREGDLLWERLRARLDACIDRPLDSADPGGWRGQDVYAHFARWQQATIDAVSALLDGRLPEPPSEDEDTLNDRWAIEDRALSAEEARTRCLATRDELTGLLAGLDGAQWERFGRLCSPDISGEHYAHHLRAAGG
jgi:hypothetical protein